MNSIRFVLTFGICLSLLQNIAAQKYFVKSYTIENGLPTRIINDACQDSDGYMWFATHNGISCYDGFRFTNYNETNGLPRQHYRSVKYDEYGLLWGVPDRVNDTIVVLQDKIWKRIGPASLKTDVEITSFEIIYKNDHPVICVGSTAGIFICQNSQWIRIDVSADQKLNHIFSVQANDGKFYILTSAGIFVVEQDNSIWKLKEFYKLPQETILAFRFEHPGKPDEKLWLLSSTRLVYLQNGKLTQFVDGVDLPLVYFTESTYLNFDQRDNIFFGNISRKFAVNRKTREILPLMVNNGFSSNGALSLFVDREQNVWFPNARGVDRISSLLIYSYFEDNGLLDNEVSAIIEMRNGNMVFGHNNGLTLYDRHTFKRIPFPESKGKLNRVMSFMQDKEGNVWVAAHNLGFGQLKPDGTIKWYKLDPAYSAVTVHQDASGKIWMGTNHVLFYLRDDKLVLYEDNEKIKSPFRKLFSTLKGEVVGTGIHGLYKISGDKVTLLPMTDSAAPGSFYSYYQDKSAAEYAGASDGLYVIENGLVHKFNKNGLSINNPVYFIFQDHEENYWFGTNNGVLKWDGKNKVETYNLQNGLAGRETNRSAGMVDSQGCVWIGTDMGLSCFSSGFSKFPTRVPDVKLLFLEDIKGDFHPLAENCSISFGGNTIFFHFRGVSFVNEDQILYRYKLEGYDQDWQFIDQSDLDKVKYSGIQPGKYTLLVQARNGEGEWSEMAKSGTITVNTPYYLTWWFFLIVFLFVFLIVYAIIKLTMQHRYRLKLEGEILERMRSEQKTTQTLEALHISEQKYHDLIEFAVDGILIGSKDGTITGANTQMKRLAGRTEDNLVGLKVQALFSKDLLSAVPLRFDLLEEGEVVVSRRSLLRPDGTNIPVEMHTKMMPDGSYQSIYHDITNRVLAENALKEKVNELARFNSLMVGRELKMIELKKEINELLMSLNKPVKYIVHE